MSVLHVRSARTGACGISAIAAKECGDRGHSPNKRADCTPDAAAGRGALPHAGQLGWHKGWRPRVPAAARQQGQGEPLLAAAQRVLFYTEHGSDAGDRLRSVVSAAAGQAPPALLVCSWLHLLIKENLMIAYVARLFSLAFLLALGAGCGSTPTGGACPGPGCACTGASCSCTAGANCTWQGTTATGCNASGGSCSFECTGASTCQGSCQGSCSAACKDNSTCALTTGTSGSIDCNRSSCTLTVGTSGSVSCTNGATCPGPSCSVSCSGGSTCDLICPGTTTPRSIPGGGQC